MVAKSDRKLRPAFFYRIESDPLVRFWTGMGPRYIAPDAVETEGAVYMGVDFATELPSFSLLANGTADSLTMGLLGVNDRILDLVDLDADVVEGRTVHIAFVLFNEDWQIARPPYWMKHFRVAKIGFSLTVTGDDTADSTHAAGVSMTLGYGDGRRKRGAGGYWTPDRAALGDRGLEHVPALDAGVTRQFPPLGK